MWSPTIAGVVITACRPSVWISLSPFPFHSTVAAGFLSSSEHQRPVVERGEEQLRSVLHWNRHGHRSANLVRLLPVQLSRRRVQRGYCPGIPDDELPDASGGDDNRLCDTELGLRRQRSPELFARHLVEGDDLGVGPAANHGDEPAPVHNRRAREAPVKGPLQPIGLVVDGEILFPEDRAGLCIEAEQLAVGTDDVHAVAVDGWRGARPDRPGDSSIVNLPFLRPEDFAGLLIELKSALDAPRPLRLHVIEDEHAAAGDRGARVARSDRRAPQNLQPVVRELLEDPGLGPDAETPFSGDFRPVCSASHCSRDDAQGNDG